MSFIDAHVHVWTHARPPYPDAATPFPAGIPVGRPVPLSLPHFGPEDILRLAQPSGVNRVVLIQMSNYGTDNRYMLDTIARQPRAFRGVAVIDHRTDDVPGAMRRLKARGVRGFRIYGLQSLRQDLRRWLDHPGFGVMFRTAARENMVISALVDPAALPELAAMGARYPDTPVVIDHCARIGADGHIPADQAARLCGLAQHHNVHVKVSAFYALGAKRPPHGDLLPMIRRLCDAFGPRRLLWASDCPYQTLHETYEDSIALIRDRADFLSASDRRDVLGATAERLFFA